MKAKIFYVLFFFFCAGAMPLAGYANSNTRKYCETLLDSAKKEYYARNYAKSLEICTSLRPIAKENEFIELEVTTLNLIGLIYLDLFDYDNAMDCFVEVYDMAIKSSNLKAEIFALSNITLIYEENDEFDKSLDYLKKAYTISLKLGDSIKIGEMAANIANIAIKIGDVALAEQYITIAKNIQTDDKRHLINTQLVIIAFLMLKKDYAMAESMALYTLQQEIAPIYKIRLYFRLSEIYQKKGDFEKAIQYTHELLKGKSTTVEKIAAYKYLSELYQQTDSLALALQYKDSLVQSKDLLFKTSSKQYMETSRIQIDLLNSEKELAENRAKQKIERIIFMVVIIAIFVLAVVFIWILRIQSIRNKQRKQITELRLEQEKNQNLLQQEQLNNEKLRLEQQLSNEKLRLEQQLKEQETIALLEQERLQNEVNEKLLLKQRLKEEEMMRLLEQERLNNEIETKNKQLLAKALSQSDRDELLKEVLSLLSNISQQSDNPQLGITMRKLKTQLKKSTDWDDFLTQFERINPSFFYSLKEEFPTLTTNDIHLLSYIYLNLDTQKISDLLNISIETCQKKKLRLANKMGLKTTELHVFLVNKIKFHIPK